MSTINLKDFVFREIDVNPTYYSERTRAATYLLAGRETSRRGNNRLAKYCFGCAAGVYKDIGLPFAERKCLVRAGVEAATVGDDYYNQEAGFAFGLAGDSRKLEAHLQTIRLKEKDIVSGTWMEHARFLAKSNSPK